MTARQKWPSAVPGSKFQTMARVYDTDLHVPVTLIAGRTDDGPNVLVTSGIHGSEYPGTMACIELADEIDPRKASGRLLMIHPVNVSAFRSRVSYIMPEDGRNLNRQFPGSSEGSISEILARWLTDLQEAADFYLDLHSGDLFEALMPYVYFPSRGESKILEASMAMARLVDVRYMVKSHAVTGAYNSAANRGVPSILIERGSAGACTAKDVYLYKYDILNILRHLGFLPGQPSYPPESHIEINEVDYLESTCWACWRSEVAVGQIVSEGDQLGRTFDFFNRTIEEFHAKHNGVVLYKLRSLSTNPGDVLVAYGK
ncbi:MAG: succinylglutamate desuccinylase/aspartoacylase family protein [Deltaproteobacteria bacterium]|jgi:predicted deacylase|nr:succinylglutamate desuccinylase/aspartoacylase family protein [Deltaproteobacteria bacterium]